MQQSHSVSTLTKIRLPKIAGSHIQGFMSFYIIFKDSFLHTILLIDTFVLTTTLVLLSTVEIFSVFLLIFL